MVSKSMYCWLHVDFVPKQEIWTNSDWKQYEQTTLECNCLRVNDKVSYTVSKSIQRIISCFRLIILHHKSPTMLSTCWNLHMFELNLCMHEQVFGGWAHVGISTCLSWICGCMNRCLEFSKKKKEQVFGGQFAALLTVIRRWLCWLQHSIGWDYQNNHRSMGIFWMFWGWSFKTESSENASCFRGKSEAAHVGATWLATLNHQSIN